MYEPPHVPPDPSEGRATQAGARVREAARPSGGGSGLEPESSASADAPTTARGSSVDSRRAAVVPPAAAMPRPGDVLGVFLLEEAIGAGGMGAVFRAHDVTLDREVALKLLPPDQVGDPEVVQRFHQEGRSAARLDHENIARIYSLGQDGPYHFIVFEYVAGETIRRRVDDRGPMTVAETVDVALQIAQALVHAALRGVVHRDVKPSNIIITPEGRAKLVDMGLARRFERQGDRAGLTQTGMTLGTFDYISPEQARDPRDVDVRGDLYSLGCTMFHMLTGRPPFSGGTVLQKLLQHQEEPPPDVRELNPEVPPELARVLARLLAKDRDRRIQTPEQLARELLGVAGRRGIPLPRFEAAAAVVERPAWERPLAFATAAGFLLLAAGLFYWGRELLDPSASTPVVEYPSLSDSRPATSPRPTTATAGPAAASSSPRKIDARPGDDLAAILASAPHKSVVTLVEDGPYLLTGRAPAARGEPRDLTIRAQAGKRPVLRFVADAAGVGRSGSALLTFARGRIVLEGLTFEADGRALDDRIAAIVLDDAELQLIGCAFRRGGGPGIPAVLGRVARPEAPGGRPPAIVARRCHFDPGAAAIECRGPADVKLFDCTFGPGGSAVVLAAAGSTDPRDVAASRCSFMAGAAPVFQVRGPRADFRVDDCVLAPADASAVDRALVLADSARDLEWLGRGNLYGGFDAFLKIAGRPASEDAATDFDRWRAGLREDRSILADSPVWDSPDPAGDLARGPDAPARAFRLAAAEDRPTAVGARKGPFGALIVEPAPIRPAADAPAVATLPPALGSSEGSAEVSTPTVVPTPIADVPAVKPPPTTANPSVALADPGPMDVPTMPPMTTAEPVEVEPTPTTPPSVVEPKPAPAAVAADAAGEEDLVRGAEQLQSMLAAPARGGDGGELRLAAGADLELTTLTLPPGDWTIAAQPGGRRPRLRFHASPFDSSTGWTALFQVRSGGLTLRGLDLQVEDADHQSTARLAAACVAPGASLELVDCTVSVTGKAPARAAIVVPPPRDPSGAEAVESALVRLRDAFVRSDGDVIFASAGRRLDARFENAVIAADGGLLRGQGGGGRSPEGPSLTMRLDRVLARVKGGVVHLEGSASEPGLPMAEVVARDSVFSTGDDGAPLLRVDGRGRSDDLADRIRWTGDDVGYHGVTTYRADDSGRIGVSPKRYARSDWLMSFDARDDQPTLDVEFADDEAPSLPARELTPASLRLSPRGPAPARGPDFDAVPSPPAVGS